MTGGVVSFSVANKPPWIRPTERLIAKATKDIAKAIKMELYNNAYEQAIGTIADKTATAELASQHEFIVHSCYQRAYKQLKMKYEIGLELLCSIKKVISRRQNALNLTGRAHN